ncbi:MAG: dihydroorotase family protein [Candidatus Micrarchaeia archaeon]
MLIRGAMAVVGGELIRADVLVEGERIAKVASRIEGDEETVDATGLILLPGLVDCHVHFREPGLTHKEDFYTGGCAALAGGVTTIIDMPNTKPPTTTKAAWQEKLERAKSKAVCDYALYFGGVDGNQDEVERTSPPFLKIYLGHSTGALGVKDEEARGHFERFPHNRLLAVHAEDEECVRAALRAREGTRLTASIHHLLRPKQCALRAVEKAARWSQEVGRRTHLCHATTREEVEAAKASGLSVEVTPHHLFLSTKDIRELGNYAKVNPPLREPHDVAGLWGALERIDCIATDHAPHTRDEKEQAYVDSPSGMPGLETTLPLFLDAARRGRIRLERFVAMACSSPAKIFGLESKGEIAVGKDADLVLVDARERWIVRGDELHTKCRWSAFEGRELVGKVKKTILRGAIVFEDGQVLAKRGFGKRLA